MLNNVSKIRNFFLLELNTLGGGRGARTRIDHKKSKVEFFNVLEFPRAVRIVIDCPSLSSLLFCPTLRYFRGWERCVLQTHKNTLCPPPLLDNWQKYVQCTTFLLHTCLKISVKFRKTIRMHFTFWYPIFISVHYSLSALEFKVLQF